MRVNKILLAASAVCAAVLVSAVTEVRAQAPPPPVKHETADKADADMTARCQAMMAEREKKLAEMKTSDARLDALVATMNAASAADKANATAAVVTEMVAQRRSMRTGMDRMQHGAMGHMMEHMRGGKPGMEHCPMMKSMGDARH